MCTSNLLKGGTNRRCRLAYDVASERIFPFKGFLWLFCQYLCNRSHFCLHRILSSRGVVMLIFSLPMKSTKKKKKKKERKSCSWRICYFCHCSRPCWPCSWRHWYGLRNTKWQRSRPCFFLSLFLFFATFKRRFLTNQAIYQLKNYSEYMTSGRDSLHRLQSAINHGSRRPQTETAGAHQWEKPVVSLTQSGMKPQKKDAGGKKSMQPPNHSQPKPSSVQSAVGCAHPESDSTVTNEHARADHQPSPNPRLREISHHHHPLE